MNAGEYRLAVLHHHGIYLGIGVVIYQEGHHLVILFRKLDGHAVSAVALRGVGP